MTNKILFKSYDCDCLYINEENDSLDELKEQTRTEELVVRCKKHGNFMYPKSYFDENKENNK